MRKQAETLHGSKGYKLAIAVSYPFYSLGRFQNRISWYTFQMLFAQRRGLGRSYF